MFDNIDDKIKSLAAVLCWIGIIVCIIVGIIFISIDEDLIFSGLLIAVIGSLISWAGSFVLYGFGELIENSNVIILQNKQLLSMKSSESNSNKSNAENENTDVQVKASQTASPVANSSVSGTASINPKPSGQQPDNTNVKTVEVSAVNGLVICPECGTSQLGGRNRCRKCGAYFHNI